MVKDRVSHGQLRGRPIDLWRCNQRWKMDLKNYRFYYFWFNLCPFLYRLYLISHFNHNLWFLQRVSIAIAMQTASGGSRKKYLGGLAPHYLGGNHG